MTDPSTDRAIALDAPPAPSPGWAGAEDLAAALGRLYAACGQPPPVLIVADDPRALAQQVRVLERLPGPLTTLASIALLAAAIGLAGLAVAGDGPGWVAGLIPAAIAALIPATWPSQLTARIPGLPSALLPWLPGIAALLAGAGGGTLTGSPAMALRAAAWAGAGAAGLLAAGALLAGPCGRLWLCLRYPGLRRAVGWRGVLLGAHPLPGLAATLGRGLAYVGDPLRGPLARHGQPRVRRHLDCATRLEAALGMAGLPWRAPGQGLGLGLPQTASVWGEARREAERERVWLELPLDGEGRATWESAGTAGTRKARQGEAALAAAEAVEACADAAWPLCGVAVVLPVPLAR